MRMYAPAKAFSALVCLGAAASSQAMVAYSNLGLDDSFKTGVGCTVSNMEGVSNSVACRFTSLATGMLDRVSLPLGHVSGTNTAQIRLFADEGGALGLHLISWTTGSFPQFGEDYGPTVLDNPFTDPDLFPNLMLHEGSSYWVEVSTPGPDSWFAWNHNSIGDIGLTSYSNDNWTTWRDDDDHERPAFRVEVKGSAVPGPAALLPFALGIVVAWRRRR